jgi:hypothetical protein
VFQAGGLVVVLIEVSRKAYLASIVPVIVNAILGEHQIVADIVAFVNKGDFPRSRLGEKQRGKILAGWVTRKMRTVAQFAIRDAHANALEVADGTSENHRASVGSIRSNNAPGASSLRNMEHAPQILEQEELDHQMDKMSALPQRAELSATGGSRSDFSSNADNQAGYTLPQFDRFGEEFQLPTQQQGPPQIRFPAGDGLDAQALTEDEEWQRDAIMHMNLASQG